jgi:DNA mismatch endonuclease (patch repair protein)
MRRVKRRDNLFEKSIRSRLYARGVRYRLHFPLPGLKRISCDFALPGLKIAIFLDGCFWHGCELHPPIVKKNAEFWLAKIERNRARDQKVVVHLKSMGWTALRFWEHEKPEDVVEAIVVARSSAQRLDS